MGQLITVVLAIALAALLVAGGINYMNPDIGVRTATTERIVSSFRILDGAIATYRIANRGARPSVASLVTPPASQAWRKEVEQFLPGGEMLDIDGFDWSYLQDGPSQRILCLSSASTPNATYRDAMDKAAAKIDGAVIAADCTGATPTASGPSAIIFKTN